jgi:hypothetical protein
MPTVALKMFYKCFTLLKTLHTMYGPALEAEPLPRVLIRFTILVQAFPL